MADAFGVMNPGGVPWLLDKLNSAYEADNLSSIEQTAGRKAFIEFARKWMEKNRPSELQYADANYCIRLQDGSSALVAPNCGATSGDLQRCDAVMVTTENLAAAGNMAPNNQFIMVNNGQQMR